MMIRSKAQVVEAYRRETITDGAVRVMAHKGTRRVTMHDIASAAGVSKATLYLYFRNCEAIRRAAEDRVGDVLADQLEHAVDAGGTLEDMLMRVLRRSLELVDARNDAMLAALALSNESRVEFDAQVFARVRKRLPEVDSPARLSFVLDCLRGMLDRRLRDATKQPRERIAASTAAMLLHGIASTPAASTTFERSSP